ncbi:hypothetical protein [Pseudomonas sp. SDO55104_S430]
MSLTIGFPQASVINIGGKPSSTTDTLSESTSDTAAQRLGVEEEKSTILGKDINRTEKAESADSNQSPTVKELLKRMRELQEQLREQQQQLAATQAASFPTPEAKTTAIMAIQAQIMSTTAALMQVVASLAKELAGSGNVVNTTA